MTKTIPLYALLLVCALSPLAVHAGGGTAQNKGSFIVRIQNTSTGTTSTPLVAIDSVEIGDGGNTAASIGGASLGSVAQTYRMSKTEVTIAQYTTFLNAIAQRGDGANGAVVESLYDSRMGTDLNVAGISRAGAGTESSPYVYTTIGDSSKPIAYVTWFNAARFANWLHNGATTTSDIENGAYPLNGALSGIITKNTSATFWIPSEDEWFKAAHYKGGSTSAGYWRFPTQSDDFPENSSSTNANNANFQRLGVFSVTQGTTLDAAQNYLTAVGTFTGSPSAYGTFDQGGNVDEWTDTTTSTQFGIARITRGGAWNSGGLNSDVSPTSTALPNDRTNKIGFRLATVAGSASGGTLSGTFMVKVGTPQTALRRLAPNEITQFSLRQGTFLVEAQDAVNPNLKAAKEFSTRNNRTTRITVSSAGGTITIQEAPAGATF